MSEENKEPRKLRRGINNETHAVTQLKFHEKDAAQNGLFIGHLADIKVEYSKTDDNKSFAGLAVPRLTFHFASEHANVNEQRHVYQTLFPVESNVNTIPEGSEEWKIKNVFNWIKHILDIFYLKGRELTDKEVEALELPFVDFTEEGEYVSVDPEEVLKGYAFIFNNTVAMLNGTFNAVEGETPKPCYKDANGKYLKIWMKLLRHKKRKDGWINVTQNGELGFDTFIGSGVIELQKPNTPPSILRIDLSKESITPKETKKQPTLGGQMLGGVTTPNFMESGMNMNPAFNEADNDMPF